jgi:methyl-accepting chemotaxis protein
MRNPFTKSLMVKLTALFITAALIPLIVVGWLSYRSSKAGLENAAFQKLDAVRDLEKAELINYLQARVNSLKLLAAAPGTAIAFDKLTTYHDAGGGAANEPFNVASQEYKSIYDSIESHLRKYVKVSGDYDVFYIRAAHGHVLFSVSKESDLGTNLSVGPYKDSGLARLWAEVVRQRKTALVDFEYYAPSGEPAAFIGEPVFDEAGGLRGVAAVQISTAALNRITQQRSGMGETGESYVVGDDLLMRTDSRFESDSTILKRKVETVAARAALDGKKGSEVIEDYRGVRVLSAYCPLGLKETFGADFDWAIISEIDESEAFAPIYSLLVRILWIGGVIGVLAALGGYFAARGIAGPVRRVSELAVKVGQGDLTVDLSAMAKNRTDEIGKLTEAFQTMVDNLRAQTTEIGEAVETLSSSSGEIASSITQVTTGSQETATAVTETTTTVEELKQTADLAANKAQSVSDSAKQASEISQQGLDATEQVNEKMDSIKGQMDAIGESVMSLSEQSQAIGEIISTVDDLAEQSNLLSVNASVEAAKAGEQGKGFAVVAQEIKAMAVQSKESTKQVRSILSDIQKATGATVMASEQGSKAVDEGAKQAVDAGQSIKRLAASVEEAAQAAVQIAASNRQQATGVEQVSSAMESVKQASEQNADSMKQLESAARNLQGVGQNLTELVAQWKV